MDSMEITPTNPFFVVDEPFILIAPTYEKEVTEIIDDFMDFEDNYLNCYGVCGGGNRNFADLFLFTARDLAVKYDLAYLHEFEFQGSKNDVAAVNEIVSNLISGKVKYLTPKEQGYFGEAKGSYNRTEIKVVKDETVAANYVGGIK